MLDNEPNGGTPSAAEPEENSQTHSTERTTEGGTPNQPGERAASEPTRRRRAATRPAGPPVAEDEPAASRSGTGAGEGEPPRTRPDAADEAAGEANGGIPAVVFQPPKLTESAGFSRTASAGSAAGDPGEEAASRAADSAAEEAGETPRPAGRDRSGDTDDEEPTDDSEERPGRRRRRRGGRNRGKGKQSQAAPDGDSGDGSESASERAQPDAAAGGTDGSGATEPAGDGPPTGGEPPDETGPEKGEQAPAQPSRRRSGKKRESARDAESTAQAGSSEPPDSKDGGEQQPHTPEDDATGEQARDQQDEGGTRRRRRRRRRSAGDDGTGDDTDDPPNTVVKVREPRRSEDEVQSIKGSTRLEAKKQRRREGRDQGRRRPPIISESEFLARRESVERVLVVRQRGDSTQIAVLEDGVLVEHYVDRSSHMSYVGNVYLGKVQNVLPSMEAAFVDIGKGRNGVLYAGEVNYDVTGLEGQPKRIEQALKSGQNVPVQVTKDPHGHKGARLTSQISLPGRYLVYVPEGSMTGISRKLPEKERSRLKSILKKVMPEDAGVIVRTAAEGASEEELSRDISRLSAQWEDIQRKSKSSGAPSLLYGEPDLTIRVVRDIFNEDFTGLVVAADDAWDTIDAYVRHVAPHLLDRLRRWTEDEDVFAAYRVDEQISKALDRKVWLPSGGSLVIDRTEAMIVVDVNTGRFTGQGGNLEETVTKNNLEAAEELVRQLRLRDLGGIIVVDFIDMVLESNRELVLRRLLECLARDRTKHQVAEVTSLGLVQMTRKRVGQGLLEAFSQNCDCCNGRGVIVSQEALEPAADSSGSDGGGSRSGGRRGDDSEDGARGKSGKGGKSGKVAGKGRSSGKRPAMAGAFGGSQSENQDADDSSQPSPNGAQSPQDTDSEPESAEHAPGPSQGD